MNVLYWRQDLLEKRLSFYVGKIHPNEFVTLSMFNNDERTQFLNGANDGNLAVASDGTEPTCHRSEQLGAHRQCRVPPTRC